MTFKCVPFHFSPAHASFLQNLHKYFSSDLPKQNQENKKKKVFYQVAFYLNNKRHSASQTRALDLSDLRVLHRKRHGEK